MGLSNEERIKGLYWTISKMNDLISESKDDFCYDKELPKLIKKLWHAFLGTTRNSSHWILGSSATNIVRWSTTTPWGIAVTHYCNGILEKKSELFKKPKNFFDAFEGFLDITGLLQQVDRQYSTTYEIYSYNEQIIYYLRRYDDELLSDLEELSCLTSNIHGECFKLFSQNEVYARAYVLNIVLKLIYGDYYPYQEEKWDILTKHLSKNHCHHDLSRIMHEGELKQLSELHVKLHQAKETKKLTLMMRLEAFLMLAGHRYHYDHIFNTLVQSLKQKRFNKQYIEKLSKMFEQNKIDHEKNEKDSSQQYKINQLSPLSIYDITLE